MSKPFSTRSLFFNGTDEYVTMGNVLGFERTDAFSISCWVKAVFTSDGYLVTKVSEDPFTGYALHFETAGTFRFFVSSALSTNAADVRTSSSGWDDGRWHHVCATYDGSSAIAGIRIYVDGKSQTLSTIRNNLSASILSSASFNLAGRTDGSVLFNDNMGEVAVFDRELTAKEVRQAFNFGSPPDLSLLPFSDRVAGWWRMGNGDTLPTLTDHGYGGNNGTTVNMDSGNIKVDVPQARRHLVFDGTNEYVKMGNAAALSFERTAKFSISLWFSGAPASDGYLVSKLTATPFTGYAILHGTSGWVRVYLFNAITTNGIQVTTSSTSWADSQWHHAVVTYNGSSSASGVRIYIDGVSQALTTEQNNLSATIVNSAEFNLASRTNGSIPYAGKITQVSVWDVELSARDVAALYNLGDPPDALTVFNRRPVGYWPCDRLFLDNAGIFGSSAGVPDLSGNGNHGAPINMERGDIALGHPFTELDDEVSALPCSQLSCLFGGTDEYVTMGGVLGFERTDAFSISAWVRTTSSAVMAVTAKMGDGAIYPGYLFYLSSGAVRLTLVNDDTAGNEIITYTNVTLSPAVNDGTWHHILVTYDGSSTAAGVNFYIDSVLASKLVTTDALTGSILTGSDLYVGGRATSGSLLPFIGNLDEVSVFNKGLSLEEVWVVYNKGAPRDLSSVSFASNLVGWWRMGDGDTYPTITDRSSSGNDGTMTNMETTDITADVPTGKFSLVFDGAEYINCGNVLAFERTDSFSISVWFKTTSTSVEMMLGKMGTSFRGYDMCTQSVLQVEIVSSWPGNWIRVSTTSTWVDGKWHHVVMTYNGSSSASGVKFFVDGVQQATTTGANSLSATIVSTAQLHLGQRSGSGASPFNGNLSGFAFYDRVLTLDEVMEVYNGGNPIDLRKMASAANLVGYWPCGNGDLYPYVEDLSGNGYVGTMTNMEVTDVVNDSPFKWTPLGTPLLPIVSRYSVAFGGTDEYVTMGDVLGFERTDPFSITGWFKTISTVSQYVVSKIDATERGWLVAQDDVSFGFSFNNSSSNRILVSTPRSWNDGLWHAFAVCYDGSSSASGVSVYIDGESQPLTTTFDTLSATTVDNAALRVGGGRGDPGSIDRLWVGSLNNIAIYDIELTAAEVDRVYNGHRPPDLSKLSTASDLVGWWKMGDGDTFPILQDSSVSGYDGTMINMESSDIVHNDVPLAGGSLFLSQGGSTKNVSQISIVTSSTAVSFKDAKGYGAKTWQWSFVSYPATLLAAPTITNSEAKEASATPVTDGMYVVQLVRTDHDGRVSTDTQAFMVLDGEGHVLPSAGIDGLINSSSAAALAGWFGRADASTNIIFDAYLRWLKAALKSAQAIPLVSGRQSKSATSFEGIGVVRLDSSDFPYTSTISFEAVLEVDSGYTAEARLYNLTDDVTVLGSTLNTTSTSSTVLSGTITMPSGQKTYEVQLRVTAGGGSATCTGARIILT